MKYSYLNNRFIIHWILFIFLVCSCTVVYCKAEEKQDGNKMEFKLTSTAFKNGSFLPVKYTADGLNVSPPLAWVNPPEGTKSFALISDDPDTPVGTWVHWVIYNIPLDICELKEAVPINKIVLASARQGLNDFNKIGYSGSAPPKGKAHRYFFKIYAVDITIDLVAGSTKAHLLNAIDGHILAKAELTGLYQRF